MRTFGLLAAALLLLIVSVGPLRAQSNGEVELNWRTIDGGGGASTSETYTLIGTIGQPDAGRMSNGAYTLYGGFWSAENRDITTNASLYLPVIMR